MPLDLVDAVIATLESNQQVTQAFGDTWNQSAQTGVAKFFGDVVDQVSLPWCQITEIGEQYDFMTAQAGNLISYLANGQMTFSIWAGTRFQARQLGVVVYKALNDARLQWPAQSLMNFRMISASFVPVTDITPGMPTGFNRVFLFGYDYSGSL